MHHMNIKQFVFAASLGLGLAFSAASSAETLAEAVHTALRSNPEVGVAKHAQTTIEHEIRAARGGYLPTIDLEAGTGYERSNNTTTRGRANRPANGAGGHRDLWRKELRLTLNQMLYDGGLTSSRVNVQKARHASAGNALQEVEENIALRAVDAYLEVLRTQELVQLAQENLQTHVEYTDKISSLAEAGQGNQADVRQAEGRYARAQANVLEFQRQQQDAEAFYQAVVGTVPAGLNSGSGVNTLPGSFEMALGRATTNSPAIRAAQSNIEVARREYEGTRAPFLPRFDAELAAGQNDDLDGVPGTNDEWLAMLRMRYNLYNGGTDSANRRAANSNVRQAEALLAQAHREVEQNMRNAWHALQSSRLRLQPLQQHVLSAEQTRNAYRSQFDIGQRTLLDLLDAETELFTARTAYLNERYNHDFASYSILASAGELVRTLTGAPANNDAVASANTSSVAYTGHDAATGYNTHYHTKDGHHVYGSARTDGDITWNQ